MVQLGASSHTNKKPCHDESSKRAIYLTPKHLTCIIPLVEDHPPIWKMQPTKHIYIYIYIIPSLQYYHILVQCILSIVITYTIYFLEKIKKGKKPKVFIFSEWWCSQQTRVTIFCPEKLGDVSIWHFSPSSESCSASFIMNQVVLIRNIKHNCINIYIIPPFSLSFGSADNTHTHTYK